MSVNLAKPKIQRPVQIRRPGCEVCHCIIFTVAPAHMLVDAESSYGEVYIENVWRLLRWTSYPYSPSGAEWERRRNERAAETGIATDDSYTESEPEPEDDPIDIWDMSNCAEWWVTAEEWDERFERPGRPVVYGEDTPTDYIKVYHQVFPSRRDNDPSCKYTRQDRRKTGIMEQLRKESTHSLWKPWSLQDFGTRTLWILRI
ncbi:hypothetical protein QBC38DRAFT_450047, partial [Podospora fimiseda]